MKVFNNPPISYRSRHPSTVGQNQNGANNTKQPSNDHLNDFKGKRENQTNNLLNLSKANEGFDPSHTRYNRPSLQANNTIETPQYLNNRIKSQAPSELSRVTNYGFGRDNSSIEMSATIDNDDSAKWSPSQYLKQLKNKGSDQSNISLRLNNTLNGRELSPLDTESHFLNNNSYNVNRSQDQIKLNGSLEDLSPTLKLPLRYAGEINEMLRSYQQYEQGYSRLIQRFATKPEYSNLKGISGKEHLQKFQAISSYYLKGKDAQGAPYSRKDGYGAYLKVLESLLNSPGIKELAKATSAPKRFAQEYQNYLAPGELEKLTKFSKEFKESIKKLVQDITEEEPSLKKMAGDLIKDQLTDALTDQLKDAFSLNCMQKILTSTVGKVAMFAATVVGASAASAAISHAVTQNSNDKEIAELKAQLAKAQSSNSDNNPTIADMAAQITQMNATITQTNSLIPALADEINSLIAAYHDIVQRSDYCPRIPSNIILNTEPISDSPIWLNSTTTNIANYVSAIQATGCKEFITVK